MTVERSAAGAGPARAPAIEVGLSVVLPAFDEVDAVEPLLREIRHALGPGPEAVAAPRWEVVAVDDGSRDGTGERLEKLAGQWSWLRVVRHTSNRGQSTAIQSGVVASRFDWIVTIDADGQNVPEDIPRLLEVRDRLREPALLVSGVRVQRHDSVYRRMQTRVANAVRARVLGDACPDSSCGLKLFRREDFMALARFDHMHRFMPALFLRHGVRAVYLPVQHRPRRTGRSKYGMGNRLFTGLVDLFGVAWLLRRPLEQETDVRIDDLRGEGVALARVRSAGAVRTADAGAVDRQ